MLKKFAGISVLVSLLALPGASAAQTPLELTPEAFVSGLRSQLPVALEDGSAITHAVVSGPVAVELTIGGANGPVTGTRPREYLMASSAAQTVASALCPNPAIVDRFLGKDRVIYLNLPVSRQGPARYKIDAAVCAARRPRPVEIARPLPSLPGPAIVRHSRGGRFDSFESCADWESRLAAAAPNNAWLMAYRAPEVVKGEFETTAAFEARRAGREEPFVNLAFKVDPSGLTYDADRSVMRIDLLAHATLHEDEVLSDTYLAGNAFGAVAEIERSRMNRFDARFENARAVLPAGRDLPMTADAARALKERGVVRVLASVIGQNESYVRYRRPTLDDPRDSGALVNEATLRPYCVAVTVDGRQIQDWQEF